MESEWEAELQICICNCLLVWTLGLMNCAWGDVSGEIVVAVSCILTRITNIFAVPNRTVGHDSALVPRVLCPGVKRHSSTREAWVARSV
jgi:hypothetical protein